jgi:hypothetical protein
MEEGNTMKAPRKTRPQYVRLTGDDFALVTQAAEKLSRRADGLRVTVSDVIRLGAIRYARDVVDPDHAGEAPSFPQAA